MWRGRWVGAWMGVMGEESYRFALLAAAPCANDLKDCYPTGIRRWKRVA